MDKELLGMIVTNSAANKSPAHPNGFCYIPEVMEERVRALETAKLIEVGPAAADKSLPVRITDAGMKAHAEPARAATVQHQAFAMPVVIEDNVPLPPSQRFGRSPAGQSAVERFPFNDIAIGQSFFVPGTPGADKPMHRTFSSVVSQANRKLYPKDFAIRAEKKDGTEGARVWRQADLTSPRPQRARKATSQPVVQTGTAEQPPFATPAVGGFSTPQIGSGFGGAVLSTAPAFGGGFPAPGAPAGFGAAPGAPTAFPAPGPGFMAPGAPAPNAWASGPVIDQGSAGDE